MKCELHYIENLDEIEKAEAMNMDAPKIVENYMPFLIDVDVIKAACLTLDKLSINLFALNDKFTIKYTKEIWNRLEAKLS